MSTKAQVSLKTLMQAVRKPATLKSLLEKGPEFIVPMLSEEPIAYDGTRERSPSVNPRLKAVVQVLWNLRVDAKTTPHLAELAYGPDRRGRTAARAALAASPVDIEAQLIPAKLRAADEESRVGC